MLPEVLSADVCSLKQGEDRAAMVCHMHISPEGKVAWTKFSRAIVQISQNIPYEDAQARADDNFAHARLGIEDATAKTERNSSAAHVRDTALLHLWEAWRLLTVQPHMTALE